MPLTFYSRIMSWQLLALSLTSFFSNSLHVQWTTVFHLFYQVCFCYIRFNTWGLFIWSCTQMAQWMSQSPVHQETVVLYSRVEPEVLERAGWNHQFCKKWPGKGIDISVLHFLFFVFTSSVFLIKYFSELSTKGGGGTGRPLPYV